MANIVIHHQARRRCRGCSRPRGAPLLRGARGLPPVRPAAVQALLLALSRLAVESAGQLLGVDINPLVPTPDGDLLALDASLFPRRQ